MTPERWQKAKAIFEGAIERQSADRADFVERACGNDEPLRREVESLLAAHEKDGSFIDAPAYQQVANSLVQEPTELKPGETIDSYEIVSFISRGGMGEVYLAQDNRLGRRVALKLLPVSFAQETDRLRRFEQEARAASALNHPNIITIHEIREANSTLMITTEFVEGKTLRQFLAHEKPDLRRTLQIAIQIADALAAAHQAGIIHRDIKPDNVMVRPDGYVKVLDFGLAKLADRTSPMSRAEAQTRKVRTGSGVIIGTVGYMSPEQARGKNVDPRTDIFSLGAVIYEMVTGLKPFDGETPSDVVAAILKSEPPMLSEVEPTAPPELVRIVTKTLRKDREQRYQVVKELLIDLKSLKEELDFQAKLDRTVQPDRTEESAAASPTKPAAETNELKTAVSTITHSLSSGIKRHKVGASLVVGAIAVAIIAGIFGVYKLLTRGPKSAETSQVLRTTQIATRTGREIPALSPDGNSIAYASRPDKGSPEIFVKPLTPGAREIQLTSDGARNTEPVWSPDGKWIAYTSGRLGGIWAIPATGGTAKQLTSFGANPAWSADASSIAFQSEAATIMPPTTIWTVSFQGGDPVQITQRGNPEGGHSVPAWSPDGRRIMFVAYAGVMPGQLWTVAAKGGDLRQAVTNNDLWFRGHVYAPDGRSVYSGVVTEAGSFGICQIPISPITGDATGAPQMIKDIGLNYPACNPTISADGKKLLYCTSAPSGELLSIPISPTSHEAIGEPKPLVQSSGYRKALPAFSDDGRTIAYLLWNAGENQKIWIMDADGSNPRQLTSGREVNWAQNWLPDNDTIVFISQPNGTQEIHAVSVSTGREKLLFKAPQSMGWVRVSPDGQQLAFLSTKGETINVWVMPITGGPARQLTFDRETIGWPSWSPDGKTLAVQMKRGSNTYLAIMPSSGGEVTQLTFDAGLVHPHDWSPDGDKILFGAGRDGVWNIYWYSLSTRQQKQLTKYTGRNHYVRYPSWSPRGDQIVYEYSEGRTGSIWLMELK